MALTTAILDTWVRLAGLRARAWCWRGRRDLLMLTENLYVQVRCAGIAAVLLTSTVAATSGGDNSTTPVADFFLPAACRQVRPLVSPRPKKVMPPGAAAGPPKAPTTAQREREREPTKMALQPQPLAMAEPPTRLSIKEALCVRRYQDDPPSHGRERVVKAYLRDSHNTPQQGLDR
jgi:hypothetical protein